MDQSDEPQEIICSGGIKVNLGAVFGGRPEQDEPVVEDQEDGE